MVARLLFTDPTERGTLGRDERGHRSTFPDFSIISDFRGIRYGKLVWKKRVKLERSIFHLKRESVRDFLLTDDNLAVATSELGSNSTLKYLAAEI